MFKIKNVNLKRILVVFMTDEKFEQCLIFTELTNTYIRKYIADNMNL